MFIGFVVFALVVDAPRNVNALGEKHEHGKFALRENLLIHDMFCLIR